jgi:hypothetical protein
MADSTKAISAFVRRARFMGLPNNVPFGMLNATPFGVAEIARDNSSNGQDVQNRTASPCRPPTIVKSGGVANSVQARHRDGCVITDEQHQTRSERGRNQM